jgi:hypothetical protein
MINDEASRNPYSTFSVILDAVRRWSYPAPLVMVILCAAGCSSGGGRQSTPTTTADVTTTTSLASPTRISGGGTGPTRAAPVVKLGPCAPTLIKAMNGAHQLETSLGSTGTIRTRLAKELVPITALRMRFCKYSTIQQLAVSRMLSAKDTAQLERDTNRLRRSKQVVTSPAGGCADPSAYPHGGAVPSFVLTFANDTQKAAVTGWECGTLTNGFFYAALTTAWLREIHVLISSADPRLATTGPQG